jgi:hypothetical protein
MTSLRQIEANRRNARLSTGPVTEEGKRRSRQNALRHGLTAETVIDALEDADDYAAFEMAVTGDYEAESAVQRELVLRLASLLWRLRRATAIESGLFKIQAKQLLEFAHHKRQGIIDGICHVPVAGEDVQQNADDPIHGADCLSSSRSEDQFDNMTRSYLRLTELPNYPLDRLSRYECTLWRQARQTIFALRTLGGSRAVRSTRLRDGVPW